MAPSRKGLAIASAGLVLSVLPALVSPALWPAWVAFWALYLALTGLDAALALGPRQLAVKLEAPATLHVGASHEAALLLTARTARPVPVEVSVDLSEGLEAAPQRRATLTREIARVPLLLKAKRRGAEDVEHVWVRYEGPLGLVEQRARLLVGRTLGVVPDVPRVRADALKFFSSRDQAAGLKIERFAGDGSELNALREYAAGDDRRALDWKASARHHKLLVREFRAERSHPIVLAVDAGRLMAEPLAGVPRLDHAVHAALLLAYVSARAGDRVGLYAFDERPRAFLAPRAGMAGFRAVLERTSQLGYSGAESNFTLGLTDLLGQLRRRSLVVVLTDFVDTVTAELMVENVERLAKRHLVLFVALHDPLLRELATTRPRSLADVHRAVVADSMALDREIVLKRLTRKGVLCIDAAPGKIGPALVNRYLEIKRREMI